ncbi:hypothetical protein ACFLYU_05660 [Candidatus Dependentiae bacterium]
MVYKSYFVICFVLGFTFQSMVCMKTIQIKKIKKVMRKKAKVLICRLIQKRDSAKEEKVIDDDGLNFKEKWAKLVAINEKAIFCKKRVNNRIDKIVGMLHECNLVDLKNYFGFFTNHMVKRIFITCKTDKLACAILVSYLDLLKKKEKKKKYYMNLRFMVFGGSLAVTFLMGCLLSLYL